jgi:hypothetical protein
MTEDVRRTLQATVLLCVILSASTIVLGLPAALLYLIFY